MKSMKSLAVLAAALVLAAPAHAGNITVKGSDTLVVLAQKWAETYMSKNADTKIQVTGGGTGTGFAALQNKTTDLCNASRKIKAAEITTCIKATRCSLRPSNWGLPAQSRVQLVMMPTASSGCPADTSGKPSTWRRQLSWSNCSTCFIAGSGTGSWLGIQQAGAQPLKTANPGAQGQGLDQQPRLAGT